MKARTLKLLVATTAFAFTLAACSSSEAPPENHSEPVSAKLFDAGTGVEMPLPYAFPSGGTRRVAVHYYSATGADISAELISEHYASITFTPSNFGTATNVAGAPKLARANGP